MDDLNATASTSPNMFTMDLKFNSVDYIMFVMMMLLSALIGVYYGCYKKQDSVSEYLHGGKKMGVFPIAMSLISRSASQTVVGLRCTLNPQLNAFYQTLESALSHTRSQMYFFSP